MSWGVFTDRNHKPLMEEALEVLADSRFLFDRLVGFIEADFRVRGEFKFYGRNYGWALRFNKSGKSLAAIYPGNGEFTSQIILDRDQTTDALKSDIGKPLKDIISNASEIHEGRWIFIRLSDETVIEDIEKLILIRAKKRARTRGGN